ncbi:MAG TPA: ATP-grasp domain-containing protein [Solirubrobacteraceae bacterium]|jgi:predicted ATP-grasp superfamily ATP-dependent carboligase|nr:ATP-grasp domain-containing protein [Solirubrobacteraceae bacterium]
MRALIVDQSRDRSALAAARMLHADGWEVGTGAWRPSIASTSSATCAFHRVEEAETDEDRFIADIAAAVRAGGYEVVFCAYDVGLLVLSRRREEIAPAIVPYAPHEVVERSFDKLAFTRAAESVGLAVPRTEEASEDALAAWRGPVVVKARIHVPTRYETKRFASAAEAAPFVAELRREGAQPLLQECITGALGAVVVVVDRDGQVVAEVQQRCDRSWPAEAGVTARARTIQPDPELSERVGELMRSLEWFGLGEVEYLLDEHGVPRFTEINGRFYGGIALAGRADVNVAAAWARLATGRPLAPLGPLGPQRVGARFQWLNRDLAASLHADGPRGLAQALALAPGSAHSMYARGDLGPLLRFYLPEMARRAAARVGVGRGAE